MTITRLDLDNLASVIGDEVGRADRDVIERGKRDIAELKGRLECQIEELGKRLSALENAVTKP